MSPPTHLFAYGTLITGTGNVLIDRLVSKHCRVVGVGYLSHARLYDLGYYPAAVRSEDSEDRISGHLLALAPDPALLETFDWYERCDRSDPKNSLFIRRRADIVITSTRVAAWVYYYNHPLPDHARVIDRFRRG